MHTWRQLLGPARKVFTTTLGFVLLIVGLVLCFTPGPGLLVVAAGLAVLARDYAWAGTALSRAKQTLSSRSKPD